MKQVIAILVAALVGAAATFILKSAAPAAASHDSENEKLKEQIAQLRGELKSTDAHGNRITTVEKEKDHLDWVPFDARQREAMPALLDDKD